MKYLRSLRPTARSLVGLGPRNVRADAIQSETRSRQTYELVGELRRRRHEPPTPGVDLRDAELRIFSQNGEDGTIHALLHAISDSPEWFLEFGVQDGGECNTRLLAEFFGWSGMYFEPDPAQSGRLKERFSCLGRIQVGSETVTPENVNQLFTDYGVPQRFGVLSIDVDGQDYWIWEALSNAYRPDVVVIEYNAAFGTESPLVERRGFPFADFRTNCFGASIEALRRLALSKGYELVHCEAAGINAFFVCQEIIDGHQMTVKGIIDRAPNYGLRGVGHNNSEARPLVDPTSQPNQRS